VKAAIREILQYVFDNPEMSTRSAIDFYFDQFIWSSEQAEWRTLTETEQQQFTDRIDAAKKEGPRRGLGRK